MFFFSKEYKGVNNDVQTLMCEYRLGLCLCRVGNSGRIVLDHQMCVFVESFVVLEFAQLLT